MEVKIAKLERKRRPARNANVIDVTMEIVTDVGSEEGKTEEKVIAKRKFAFPETVRRKTVEKKAQEYAKAYKEECRIADQEVEKRKAKAEFREMEENLVGKTIGEDDQIDDSDEPDPRA